MRSDLRLESIYTLLRIRRESKEQVEKFYSKYNWYSFHPNRTNNIKMLKYCQEGIALFKRRTWTVQRELNRREFNETHSFEKMGF
jgi:hypothetical protein